MKKDATLWRRLLMWIRIRLQEGFEALVAYRWARVLLGFFAFLGRSAYHIAGMIPDKAARLIRWDMDEAADRKLAGAEKAMEGRMRAAGARLYAIYDRAYETHRMAVKMVATTALTVLAMALLLLRTQRTTALMCAGMGFAWMSDAMLMEYPPIRRGVRQYFLWGMGGFACSMALYASAFLGVYARTKNGQGGFVLYSIFAVFAAAALLIWLGCIALNQKQLLVLRLGSLGYALLVSAMAASACAVAVATAGRAWWLIPGAVCFFASDMLIALFQFGSVRVRHPDGWIWMLYAPAQLMLLTGAYAAI